MEDIQLKSEGKCFYCEEMLTQENIREHLQNHLLQMTKEGNKKNLVNYCHIGVEAGEMFLHLLVRGSLTMKRIDQFLRDIWLECCDHLSGFGHKNFKIKMKDRVEDVFQDRIKIFHDYDYGTTTRVLLRAHKHYSLPQSDDIILLSRNEPLKLMCSICHKKPAVNICTVCWYNDYAYFCESCSKAHAETCSDFYDYANMPLVNSPRTGECGYTGGIIDVERDRPANL